MKKFAALLLVGVVASPVALAKKPGGGSGWQSGNSGHQLGCLIISLLGLQGCEKPRESNSKQ